MYSKLASTSNGRHDSKLLRLIIISNYELKKSLAKKKIFASIFLIFIAEVGGILLFRYLLSLSESGRLPVPIDKSLAWIFLFFLPGFLLATLAVLVGAGIFSEEYERGVSEILFSKPLTRSEIALGKLIGSFSLISLIIAIAGASSVILSMVFIGSQSETWRLPLIIVSSIYANLTFYSLAVMLSQLTRNTLISSVIPIALLIIFPIVQGILVFVELSTGSDLSWAIRAIPTWSINLPAFLIPREILIRALATSPIVTVFYGSPFPAFLIILGYLITFLTTCFIHLLLTDIQR